MGTRGLLCFIINGKKRGFFNQFDSYDSGLGAAIVLFILLLVEREWDIMQQRLEVVGHTTLNGDKTVTLIL